jgi:hypothetical protein
MFITARSRTQPSSSSGDSGIPENKLGIKMKGQRFGKDAAAAPAQDLAD